jgi:hypothetical protein
MCAPTVTAAVERGYLEEDLNDISVMGDSLEGWVVKGFKKACHLCNELPYRSIQSILYNNNLKFSNK